MTIRGAGVGMTGEEPSLYNMLSYHICFVVFSNRREMSRISAFYGGRVFISFGNIFKRAPPAKRRGVGGNPKARCHKAVFEGTLALDKGGDSLYFV